MSIIRVSISEHCEFDEEPKEVTATSLNEAEFFYLLFKMADKFHLINEE
jgi:hypothetical protein